MSIKTVKTDELRRMNGKEGLVLQGCGGDPQEWLDGINGLLTDEGTGRAALARAAKGLTRFFGVYRQRPKAPQPVYLKECS